MEEKQMGKGSHPGKGRIFKSKLQAPAQTLRALSPEVIETLAEETGSKAIAALLSGALRQVERIPEAAWDFSWDFSWDYSTKMQEVITPERGTRE